MYEPLYSKHYDVAYDVVEVEGATKEGSDETAKDQIEEKGVSDFWLNAMKNHEILADDERDMEALKYLKDIKCFRITEPNGFKLEFHFDTNPLFKNAVLTKTYQMIDEDEPIPEKAVGTKIEWYPGKCLTRKVLKKKAQKGSNNTKPNTKTETCESFFNFFSPPQVPDDDEEIGEDTAEQLQNQMEQDYYIGSTIRDKIIPHFVSWFTGEAAQEEDFELEDEEDEVNKDDDHSASCRPIRVIQLQHLRASPTG
ncbi:nucleosome assembly protein 1;2 [Lolium perenne]|uniref:nucleosome assembly protein 1;2 n=1 Tax=Lolium perenne TaxID=4522 RepID=UPI003A9979BF